MEERQLRYLGHAWRYGEDRWTKFLLQADRPGQVSTGKQNQYRKMMSKLLKDKGLDTDMMEDRNVWSAALNTLYPGDAGASQKQKEGGPSEGVQPQVE